MFLSLVVDTNLPMPADQTLQQQSGTAADHGRSLLVSEPGGSSKRQGPELRALLSPGVTPQALQLVAPSPYGSVQCPAASPAAVA